MIEEAKLQETPGGLEPAGEGWFVVNVRDTKWAVHDHFGAGCRFESRQAFFKEFGINISVLQPGQPSCFYHEENAQEDFLVLSGECKVIVNDEERTLRTWDFFHSPAGTEHLLVGGGDGPSVLLSVGTRPESEYLRYPRSEPAARYDGSAEAETTDARQAYARFERPQPGRPECWDQLPWS